MEETFTNQNINLNINLSPAKGIIAGGGEMGSLIRDFDWLSSEIGPIENWPYSLKAAVNMILPSTAPFVILWGNRGITLYNDAYISFAGGRHPLLLGNRCEEIWPEAAAFVRNVIDTCLGGESLQYKMLPYKVFRNNISEEIWMDLDCSPIIGDSGVPEGVLILNNEVTSQVLALQMKESAEERLEIAMDAAGMVGIWDYNVKENRVYLGPHLALLFSVEEDSRISGTTFKEFLEAAHPDDAERIRKSIEHAIATGEKYSEEYRLLQPDGSVKWIIARGQCYYDHENNPTRFPGVAVDITERKQMEQALLESEFRLKRIADSNVLGIINWDLNGDIYEANDAFLEILGFSREDLRSGLINWIELTPPEYLEQNYKAAEEVKTSGVFKPFEKQFFKKDGSRVDVILGGAFYEGSSRTGVAWIHDISRIRNAEEEKQKLISIIEASNDFIEMASLEGEILYVNPAGLKMAGWENINDKHIIDKIYPEDRAYAENVLLPKLINEGQVSHEIRIWNEKSGVPKWILWNAIAIKDTKTGQAVALASISPDISHIKKAEQDLKESKDRFSSIFNQSSVGIAQVDLNGKFVLVNDYYCFIVGYEKEELYQLRMQDITHPQDLEENMPLFKRAIKEGVPFNLEKRYIKPDGSIVWVHISVSVVLGPNGAPQYVVGVCNDISERILAENALAYQNKITKVLTENATMALFMLDSEGRTTYANPAAIKMTGYTFEEMEGEVLHSLVHHLHPDGTPFPIESCEIGKSIFSLGHLKNHEDILIRKDGTFFPVLCSATAIQEQEETRGIIVEVQDITDRKQAENALKESEKRFRILADQSPMIVFLVEPNPEATISYFNKAWLNYTGQSFEEAIGKAWNGIVHPDDFEKVLERYVSAFEKRETFTIPAARLKGHDGTYKWHLLKGNPRYLPNGEFLGYVGVGIDIHEQRILVNELEKKNEQLLRINNDLDNFIYTASHDLKAPISNIEGLMHLLSQSLSPVRKSGRDVNPVIEMIHTSIAKFKNTIQDLTEISKLQNAVEEDLEKVSFGELLEEEMLNIREDIEASDAIIHYDFSGAPDIYFSRKNLRSILYNLLSNAIKYRSLDRQAKINITTSKPGKTHILLAVQDNGLGIKEQDKPKVFTMFKRLHQHVEGTGIGMSIVKKIIDNNGGKIEIESEEGKGTTFKVFFLVNEHSAE